MSLGNVNTQGQKKTNAVWQKAMAQLQQNNSDILSLILVALGGGSTPTVINSTVVTVSGSVAPGSLAVTFTTDDNFAGSINGVARQASMSYVFNPTSGHTNPAIAYVITSGNITLDVII